MSYYIYPKLRAIYSVIPTPKEVESLVMSEGVLDFKNRFANMDFSKRFSLFSNDIENSLKLLPFSLTKSVGKQIPGSSGLFFDIYVRSYELRDIKDIINGSKGFFTDKLKGESPGIEELGDYLKKGFWKDCWLSALSKYRESNDKMDIKVILDKCYYSSFLKGVENLPHEEKADTKDFILILINFKNRLWLHRLKNFYNLEDFAIKKYLIPEGSVYENFSSEEGISEDVFIKKFSDICYRDFKFKMYSMRSILAFFFLLDLRVNEILSVYRTKMLNLEKERIKKILGDIYVGS